MVDSTAELDPFSVRDAAAEAPGRPALVFEDRSWTWAEVAAESATALRRMHGRIAVAGRGARPPIGTTPVVALDAHSTPAVVFTLLALIGAGLPVAPLDPRLPPPERARRLRRMPGCVDLDAPECAALDRTEVDLETSDTGLRDAGAGAERALALLFSSGSSGSPRLIELSRRAFAASASASSTRLGWEEDDRWLCCVPLAHIAGLSIIVRCLLARQTIVLTAGFEAARVAVAMRDDGVSLASLVPTMLVRLLDVQPAWEAPGTLRAILLGGAPTTGALWARVEQRGLPVRATYGMTETCAQVATAGRDDPRRLLPIDGAEFRARAGRLEVRGPMLCSSIDGLSATDGPDWTPDGYFRTGDLGSMEEGAVVVDGRADRIIVTGGEKVTPDEVERVLEAHPGVDRAIVFGLPDEAWGELVTAAVVPRRNPPSNRELAEWCAARLAPSARPRRVARIPEIPETANGKPDYIAVRRSAGPLLEAM